MDTTTSLILRVFDRLGSDRLGATDLAADVPEQSLGTMRSMLARLVAGGCLRQVSGFYERTELGRLEASGPLDITLLSRPGCHLCEAAQRQIEPLARRFGARLRIVDVDTDRTLSDRYGKEIPIVFLAGREVGRQRVDSRQLGLELARASGEGPELSRAVSQAG